MAFEESELIIRPDGAVYHLNLKPGEIPSVILTVGDPERVDRISRHLDQINFTRQSREIVAHHGRLGKMDVLVLSTGMGTDNIEIVMNELDALVNVDFDSRQVKQERQSLNIIRIGTSGSIHEDVPVESLLASETGTGLDTLMEFYAFNPGEAEQNRVAALREHLGLGFTPYQCRADDLLMERLGEGLLKGHTLTCPGFYAPQGRYLRLKGRTDNYAERLMAFRDGTFAFTNIEMETAAMYAFGSMMGHRMLSLNAIIADRRKKEFARDGHEVVDRLISHVLDRVETLG